MKLIRLLLIYLFLVGVTMIFATWNSVFKARDYKFDFENMHNPEHGLILIISTTILFCLSFTLKRQTRSTT